MQKETFQRKVLKYSKKSETGWIRIKKVFMDVEYQILRNLIGGRYTEKDGVIYAHVYETPLGALPLYGISPEKLDRITYLADGSEVKRGEAWNTALYTDVAFVSFGDDPVFTYPLPDEKDTVLKNSTQELRMRKEEKR